LASAAGSAFVRRDAIDRATFSKNSVTATRKTLLVLIAAATLGKKLTMDSMNLLNGAGITLESWRDFDLPGATKAIILG
jgi:hypothetical protein